MALAAAAEGEGSANEAAMARAISSSLSSSLASTAFADAAAAVAAAARLAGIFDRVRAASFRALMAARRRGLCAVSSGESSAVKSIASSMASPVEARDVAAGRRFATEAGVAGARAGEGGAEAALPGVGAAVALRLFAGVFGLADVDAAAGSWAGAAAADVEPPVAAASAASVVVGDASSWSAFSSAAAALFSLALFRDAGCAGEVSGVESLWASDMAAASASSSSDS